MKVKETIKTEQIKLTNDLIKKIDYSKEKILFKDLISLSIEQEIFDTETYVFSEDKEYLYDLLNFSVGLSKLWNNYIESESNKEIDYMKINKIIIEYMINMFGLEEITMKGAK